MVDDGGSGIIMFKPLHYVNLNPTMEILEFLISLHSETIILAPLDAKYQKNEKKSMI